MPEAGETGVVGRFRSFDQSSCDRSSSWRRSGAFGLANGIALELDLQSQLPERGPDVALDMRRVTQGAARAPFG